jgi:hypothetical protein
MVKTIIVKPKISNEELETIIGKNVTNDMFTRIIKEDIDVKTNDGRYLLRFRKNVLDENKIDEAFDNLLEHASERTSLRGMTGGMGGKKARMDINNPILSNIVGFYDTLSPHQKFIVKLTGIDKPICRQTAFTGKFPEKWKKVTPLIDNIDEQYKKLFPKEHRIQKREAHKTKYVIGNTAFSTITTNLNYSTSIHRDSGDFRRGFGNLVVIDNGKYKGGYLVFPRYKIGVDVRRGDFLAMDVHEAHGNSEIIGNPDEYIRLSLVSYLREQIPKKCSEQPMLPFDYFIEAYRTYKKKYGSVHKNKKTRKNKKGKRIKSRKANRGRRLYKNLLKNNLKE